MIDRFVRVPGHTCVNIKVVDDARHQVTDIDLPGVTVQAEKIDEVFATIDALAEGEAEVFVLSGSLPAGVAPTVYRDITPRLTARGHTVVLDTSGEVLGASHRGRPPPPT